MRAQTPSPKRVPLGTTTAARQGDRRQWLAFQLAHDELKEEQGGFGGLLVFGEVALDALFLLAAEGRVGEDDVHAVLFADLGQLVAQGVAGVDLRGVEPVQKQVHLAEQVGQGLGLAAEDGALLQNLAVGHGLDLFAEMVEGLDQEAAGAGGRVEHGLAQARVGDGHHEAHDRPRGVELARVAGGVAHLAQHGFVECAQGVQLVAGGEVDAGDLVDDVAQEVAAHHAVLDALEDGGDHVPAVVAVRAGQAAQVGEEPGAALAVGAGAFLLVDEGEQLIAGDALRVGGPVAPAVGRLDGGPKRFPASAASCSRCNSRSSRNLRNMIQVSIGSRSRSPFRPLSLRMMSRADLIRLPRDWAVVSGCSFFVCESVPFICLSMRRRGDSAVR